MNHTGMVSVGCVLLRSMVTLKDKSLVFSFGIFHIIRWLLLPEFIFKLEQPSVIKKV